VGLHRGSQPSLRYGLPYGWWKDPATWVAAICVVMLILMLGGILAAWFLDLKF
jgi:hypothetical protein